MISGCEAAVAMGELPTPGSMTWLGSKMEWTLAAGRFPVEAEEAEGPREAAADATGAA